MQLSIRTYLIMYVIVLLAVLNGSNSLRQKAIWSGLRLNSRTTLLQMTKIALTREDGTNNKMAKLLKGYDVVEIPCIMFADGEDTPKLPDAITKHDVIVITSPQAANVFLESWEIAGKPTNLKIATVGKGSSKPLIARGLTPIFEPSDSTGETLAAELPLEYGLKVLYPSSALAENTLAAGLENRGFQVTRLNTYCTVPAIWSKEQEELARSVQIVTFASPSAVKIWSEKVGTDFTAIVIGPTSAKAATTQGFSRYVL
jgi:uroporphyrinogen-III synthase